MNVFNDNQQPLGTQFKSYELNKATNAYILDPIQYNITKFDYNFPGTQSKNTQNQYGLVYRDVNFEKLLPTFTGTKRSVNDFPAQSYHRFEANDGYFNAREAVDNSDLWYYGSERNSQLNGYGVAGAPLNVQELNHIILSEPQRGGLDSKNLAKYSWNNTIAVPSDSWESQNLINITNNKNCEFFNYNSGYSTDRNLQPFTNVYNYDSNYCRQIGISQPSSGSMPFK
jgi:hypothetical protein